MNIREAGARSARTVTTTIGVVAAAITSILGLSIWAGTAVGASTTATTVRGSGDGRGGDDGGASNGTGTSNGLVNPGLGGGAHVNSNGS